MGIRYAVSRAVWCERAWWELYIPRWLHLCDFWGFGFWIRFIIILQWESGLLMEEEFYN